MAPARKHAAILMPAVASWGVKIVCEDFGRGDDERDVRATKGELVTDYEGEEERQVQAAAQPPRGARISTALNLLN